MSPRFIQISSTGDGSSCSLFALDDKGIVWQWSDYGKYWYKLEGTEK